MKECNELEGDILFYEGMPSNNVEDTTEYENFILQSS